MYILFEMASSRGGFEFNNLDCMGYAESEQNAMDWKNENPEYRCYKYCPRNVV